METLRVVGIMLLLGGVDATKLVERKVFVVSKLGDVKIKKAELRPAVNEGEEGEKVRLDV